MRINRIPLAVLAAVLIYVGWRLCEPRIFRKILTIGKEQLLICVVTIAVTLLTTDLLIGVAIGMLTKLALLCVHLLWASVQQIPAGQSSLRQYTRFLPAALTELFTNPVTQVAVENTCGAPQRDGVMPSAERMTWATAGTVYDTCKVSLSSITCMNLMKLDKTLSHLSVSPNPSINFVVRVSGQIIDHTSMEYLHHFQEECVEAGHTCTIVGMENFGALSSHALAARIKRHHA